MWSIVPRKIQLTTIFLTGLLAVRVWDAASVALDQDPLSLWQGISLAVAFVGTALVVIFNWIWRWLWRRVPLLARAVAPDLNGEWDGKVHSTWVDPETNAPRPPIDVCISIEQTLLKISVSLKSGESGSQSGRAFLEKHGRSGCYRLWYEYRADPKARYQHRSTSHDGVAYLEIDVNADPDHLDGYYYTARKTTGDIEARRVSR